MADATKKELEELAAFESGLDPAAVSEADAFGATLSDPLGITPEEAIEQMKSSRGSQRDDLYAEFDRVPLVKRHSAKRKRTPAGVMSNLEHHYGKGNVFDVGDDNFAILQPEGKPLLLEGAGSVWEELGADIVDVLPESAAGLLGAAGAGVGLMVGGKPGAAVGAGAGSYVAEKLLQAESDWQPGKDYPEEGTAEGIVRREGEALAAGMTDVATFGVGSKVGPFLRSMKSAGLGHTMRKVAKSEAVDPGFKTAGEAGEAALRRTMDAPPMDVAEATLATPAISKRAALRRTQPEVFAQREINRAKDVTETVERGLGNLGPSLPAENVGNAVGMLQKTARSKIRRAHTPDIDATFDFVKRVVGDTPVGAMKNTREALADTLRAKGAHPELERLLGMIDQGKFTIKDMRNQLSNFGKGQIGHKRGDKTVTKRLFSALADDLDEVADGMSQSPRTQMAGQMLRNARSAYSDMMDELEAVDDVMLRSVIKKLAPKAKLGEILPSQITKGHKLVQDLAGSGWDDAAVKNFVEVVDKVNPNVARVLRRGVFDKLMEKTVGVEGVEAIAAGGKWFDPVKIHKQMGKPGMRKRMAALVGGNTKHPTMRALDALSDVGQRISAASRAESALGAPASKKDMLRMAVGALAGGGVSGHPSGAAVGLIGIEAGSSVLSKILNRKSVAEVFLNPRAAGLLVEMLNPPASKGPAHVALAARRLLWELGEELPEGAPGFDPETESAARTAEQAEALAGEFSGGSVF